MTLAPLEDQTTRWLAGHYSRRAASYSPGTQKTYRAALRRLALFMGQADGYAALARLMAMPQAEAHATALAWRAELSARGLSTASINICLATARSAFKAAYTAGLSTYILTVPGVQHEARRDRSGPSWAKVREMLEKEPRVDARAFLALLSQRGLRLSECLGIELSHVGLNCGTVQVLGKGRRELLTLTLVPETASLLQAWLTERGRAPGRIFGFGPTMAARIVARAGKRVGVKCSPHQLRHAFASQVARKSGGDITLVANLLRHRDVKTSAAYVDDVPERAEAVLRRAIEG